MAQILSCKEARYLSQFVYRIYQTQNYEDFCKTVLSMIRSLIPYRKGIIAQAKREKGGLTSQKELYCINPPGITFDESFFMNPNYRSTWGEYLFAPWSTVLRLSDLQGAVPFEETEQYKKYYHPQDIYYGLYLTIIHNDHPLGLLALFRSKAEPDFDDREIFFMELLKIHLALKLYTLLVEQPNDHAFVLPPENNNPFSLTKREMEIIQHVCKGETDNEISHLLYISKGTLRRHVYNIYRKTNIKSRVQLMKKFE